MTTELTRSAKNAIKNYSAIVCLRGVEHCEIDGSGARTLGYGLTTRQADAAINAGRELYIKFRDGSYVAPNAEIAAQLEVLHKYFVRFPKAI